MRLIRLVNKYSIGGILVLGLASIFLFHSILPERVGSIRRARCPSNLKQLHLGIRQYELDYGYPDKLSQLYPDFMSSPRVFKCPSSRTERIIESHSQFDEIRKEIDLRTDYVYFKPNKDTRDNDIIAADRTIDNHNGKGIYVVQFDGKTYWMGQELDPENPVIKVVIGIGAGLVAGFLIARMRK